MSPAPFVIWVLFSVENNYDQPENNLEIFWREKPSLEQLAKVILAKTLGKLTTEQIVSIVELWTGKPTGFHNATCRLESIAEGVVL